MERMEVYKIPTEHKKALRSHYPAEYTAWSNFRAKARRADVGYDSAFDDFATFLEHVGPRPAANFSLDRKNNKNRRYERGNLRWATKTEQSNNRDNTVYLTYEGANPKFAGLTKPLTDWARLTDQPPPTMHKRKGQGWTDTELVDGKRDAPTKTLSQMSEDQLLNYQPWPEDTAAKDEQAYLTHAENDETRFEFDRRYLVPRAQRKIDRSAAPSMARVGNIPKGEEDHWDEEQIDRVGDWILSDEGDRPVFEKVIKKQKSLNRYMKETRELELEWLAAIKRYRLARKKQKKSSGMRSRLLEGRGRKKQQGDTDIDWEPFT